MQDGFKRDINYMRISITDRCNLRCQYCMPEEGVDEILRHDDIITFEEIENIVRESVKIGIHKFRITGGEPMVRKDIFALIKMIKSVPGVKELAMTTNGILVEGKIEELKEAGLDRINIHIDTLNDEKFMAITKSNRMLDYISIIEDCIKYDMVPIKLNAVLLKDFNVDEVPEFIELADKYDLLVRFIELMPFGHLHFDWRKHYFSPENLREMYPELKFLEDTTKAKYYQVPGKKGKIGFISTISDQFCDNCSRIRLTSDGKLKPCLHSDLEFDVKNKTVEEVVSTLKKAIKEKPEKHNIDSDEFEETIRSMNRIGG